VHATTYEILKELSLPRWTISLLYETHRPATGGVLKTEVVFYADL